MDLTLGAEQEQIRDAVRGFLGDRLPLARVRRVATEPPGFDTAAWREAAALGWFGLGLPEAEGGAGYGTPEEMLLAIELGRTLAPGPWRGTIVAAHAAPTKERAAMLAGDLRVGVVDDPDCRLGDGEVLNGPVADVPDAGLVDAFVVLKGGGVFWLPCDARGVALVVAPSMDPVRRLGRLVLTNAQPRRLHVEPAPLRRLATVLAAAEAAGVAERTLEMSVEYAKVRQQFGRPIGSFQAVKHRCADMAVRAEVARSVVTYAAVAVRDGDRDADRHAHVAKALATDAALANAADNVQNHGGIGYTWEAAAHLYLKRAWLLEHELGARVAHWDALAAPWRAG
jgi:alkylation response protein AidB-like acyl-CoA dehydrogenase